MNQAIKQAITKFKTQKRLADAIGVRQSLISHYLNGRRTPTKKTAKKLEAVYDGEIPWYAFIDGSTGLPVEGNSSEDNSSANEAA